jgi:VanZ family protein
VARAFVPAIIWAAVVLLVGGLRDVPSPATDLPLDKLVHFTLYGILGGLLAVGRGRSGVGIRIGWLIAAAAVVGAVDELHQTAILTRSASVADWVADCAGAITGTIACRRSGGPKGRV